jgi:ABC-type lipoprotein export system ATPase subunit
MTKQIRSRARSEVSERKAANISKSMDQLADILPAKLVTNSESVVTDRVLDGNASLIKLADGSSLRVRRFFPAGKGDTLRRTGQSLNVLAKNDQAWIEIGAPWRKSEHFRMAGCDVSLTFKEIETDEELAAFQQLKHFHYRGGGGAGRTVPIIAVSQSWDLPTIIGFLEISSSMIVNTARKKFFDFPYRETGGISWKLWDREAASAYSSLVCRISRFVIHPEVRGLGLAKLFTNAARIYASERWHFGGYRPRFMEITADMLKYYKFTDRNFVYMGDTEGNEHRLAKDMNYLVRKARTDAGIRGMPQGGGGIMVLQRGYALQLMKFLNGSNKTLAEVVSSLRYDPSQLDQDTWEALHRLNRRPKPSYIAGLTPAAERYIDARSALLGGGEAPQGTRSRAAAPSWQIEKLNVRVSSTISQSKDARTLQDAFGFVGSALTATPFSDVDLVFKAGELTLVCGASGSGKSLFLHAVCRVLAPSSLGAVAAVNTEYTSSVEVTGDVSQSGRVVTLVHLPDNVVPLELRERAPLDEFLHVAARCGLAEPQLFVRPVSTLSSGQRYRLQIALALLRRPQILIIDNFCEALDRFTMASVVKGVERLARENAISVIAATAAYERLSGWCSPDQTILLRRGDKPTIMHRLEDHT